MSTATRMIKQIAAGQVRGQRLKIQADLVVSASICKTCKEKRPQAEQKDRK